MRLTYDEIIRKCREYAQKVSTGEIQRAQWEHFVAFCYEDPDELEQIVQDYNEEMANRRRSETQRRNAAKKRGRPRKDAETVRDAEQDAQSEDAEKDAENAAENGYKGRVDAKRMECGAELKRLSNFIQGQLATSPYWGGAMSTKAIFLLKQNRTGRGMVEKQQVDNSGSVEIQVSFGGGLENPFG